MCSFSPPYRLSIAPYMYTHPRTQPSNTHPRRLTTRTRWRRDQSRAPVDTSHSFFTVRVVRTTHTWVGRSVLEGVHNGGYRTVRKH
eukprot:2409644-Prymnesium_polylepis.1